ncbi:MAG: hypothetical protein VX755_12370 [Pseudomonadota bacterium]|nr:hypothetical protein [Pseudomonadota bacterium]MED5538677.1 hypothetical protein [Pseudomonadota bacterium]
MNAVTTTTPRPQIMAGGQVAALVPQSLDEAFRVAQAIAASGLAPRGLDKPEQVMVAIMAGAELGLAPFQALQSFAIVNNRPTLWGDGLMAVARAQGIKAREWLDGEGDAAVAHCEVTRPDTGETIARSFSVSDAKKAGLWNKQGPWQQYPKRMLQMRARAWALRDGCADMLRGFQVREEVEDFQTVTARQVPTDGPGLAARLAAPEADAPREGFNTVHGLGDDDLTHFEADPPPASEQPSSDGTRGPRTDEGDDFPGDKAPPLTREETAEPAEANGANEGTGSAVDVLARVDRVIADFEFKSLAELKETQADRRFVAFVAAVRAQSPEQAERVEKALAKTLESFG